MNLKKFLAMTTVVALLFVGAEAAPEGRMPASELMRLEAPPRGEIVRPMQPLTSENSGLNPGYTVTPIQNTRPVSPDDVLPNVTATAAIVIEASTGHVLYERNPDQQMFPASTTKMMTLITALEGNRLDEIVTVGPGAYNAEGSTLWLDVGEKNSARRFALWHDADFG
ncbi:MAG: D-alanyl-D-alanine carboxypeptidase [Selenomonadaceae bacterium]|nr:D-alanyl-D-alanine carboxypeptidase [Selenomonadaceae bacterium]